VAIASPRCAWVVSLSAREIADGKLALTNRLSRDALCSPQKEESHVRYPSSFCRRNSKFLDCGISWLRLC
jgi:hypothetical protein